MRIPFFTPSRRHVLPVVNAQPQENAGRVNEARAALLLEVVELRTNPRIPATVAADAESKMPERMAALAQPGQAEWELARIAMNRDFLPVIYGSDTPTRDDLFEAIDKAAYASAAANERREEARRKAAMDSAQSPWAAWWRRVLRRGLCENRKNAPTGDKKT